MGPLILVPAAIAAGAGEFINTRYESPDSVSPFRAVLNAVEHGADSVRAAVTNTPALLTNHGMMPTEAQITAVMAKAGRPASLRNSITIVPRVRTSPYVGSDNLAMDMRGFAAAASRGLNTTKAGGYILAVLCSVETSAGNPFKNASGVPQGRNASCWNNNFGNVKYGGSSGLRGDSPTPPVYFLVDRRNSLDFYESFATPEQAIATIWGVRTFNQPRYTSRGFKAKLDAGDIHGVCKILGEARYADCYALGGNGTYMDGRAKVLAREGSYRNVAGAPSLDPGVIRFL